MTVGKLNGKHFRRKRKEELYSLIDKLFFQLVGIIIFHLHLKYRTFNLNLKYSLKSNKRSDLVALLLTPVGRMVSFVNYNCTWEDHCC